MHVKSVIYAQVGSTLPSKDFNTVSPHEGILMHGRHHAPPDAWASSCTNLGMNTSANMVANFTSYWIHHAHASTFCCLHNEHYDDQTPQTATTNSTSASSKVGYNYLYSVSAQSPVPQDCKQYFLNQMTHALSHWQWYCVSGKGLVSDMDGRHMSIPPVGAVSLSYDCMAIKQSRKLTTAMPSSLRCVVPRKSYILHTYNSHWHVYTCLY